MTQFFNDFSVGIPVLMHPVCWYLLGGALCGALGFLVGRNA